MIPTSGLLIVNKASGPSSKDISRLLEKKLGKSTKMGHCGTLDPLASGLLLVVLGNGTKLQSYLTGFDKSYEFTFKLGHTSESLDADSVVKVVDANVSADASRIKSVMPSFIGEISQVPPMISAKKFKGKPLYAYARSGQAGQIDIEQFAQKIKISSLKLVGVHKNEVSMTVDCSKGTYIRSLARDIAKQVGSCAIVTKLHRTRVQRFTLENATPSQDILNLSPIELREKLIPLHKIDTDAFLPVIVKSAGDIKDMRYGRTVNTLGTEILERFELVSEGGKKMNGYSLNEEQPYIFFEPDYSPIGLGNVKNNGIKFEIKVFRGLNK